MWGGGGGEVDQVKQPTVIDLSSKFCIINFMIM